ncbi:MAG: hypothetical protein QW589_03310 [Candidatus Bathyarchaeia archaeon]
MEYFSEYCSPSKCWRRLRDWQRKGVWKKIWPICLEGAKSNMGMASIDSSNPSFKGNDRYARRRSSRLKGDKGHDSIELGKVLDTILPS